MRKTLVTVLLAGILGTALPTFADPIRVTGSLHEGSSNITVFALFWPGFKLDGVTSSGLVLLRCFPCQPGDALSLSVRYEQFFGGLRLNDEPSPFTSGFLSFTSDTITVPNLSPDTTRDIARPFTFDGQFTGPGGVLDLTGSGLATISLFRFSDETGIFASSLRFELQEAAPVPEPATLLLTGAGLAGALTARRRRKQT